MAASPAADLPPELRWFVTEPRIVLLGCAPLTPDRPGGGPCPLCNGRVLDLEDRLGADRPTTVVCGRCDGMSERNEALLARQRSEARIGREATDRAESDDRAVDAAAGRLRGVELSEAQRRRLWSGNRRALAEVTDESRLSDLARAGREFLRRIGQEPDWSLVLDRRGRVVRRGDAPEFPA